MQKHIQEIVSLHSKLSERYSKELADLFVDRLTLCFFMDGMGLLFGDVSFKEILVRVGRNPQSFSKSVASVFSVIFSETGSLRLFSDQNEQIDLVISEVDHINRIRSLDWRGVSPFIFGRIFELTLESSKRSQLGAHYTPEDDIRDLIEPVILRSFREHLDRVRVRLNIGVSDVEKRDLVRDLLHEIRSVRILDPACGAGNFLLICLWSLLDIESEAIKLAEGLFETIPCVVQEQLYGIEKDSRAFRLMRVALWLGYIQWLKKNFDEIININHYSLSESQNFMNCDAILDLKALELPKEQVWPDVDYIVGNPPYLGASKMRQLFGDEYVDLLNWVFHGRVPGSADFGAYWFEKARDMIDRERAKAAGFVISTAIKQEWSRSVLDRVNQSGKIFFAISDRVWEGKEAAIHVSLIGFTGMGYRGDLILDGQVVPVIYSNLSSHHNASELRQIKNREYDCISGTGDVLENSVDQETALRFISSLSPSTFNPMRPFVGGRDLVQGSLNRWTTWDPNDSIGTGVKFSGKRFLVTPRVSKHCVFLWLDSVTVPDSGVVAWDTDDAYVMGVLQSRVHRVWTLANCGWRGETRNYQIKSCFRSFIFPCIDDKSMGEIKDSAERLNVCRTEWLYPERLIKRQHVKFCALKDGPWQHYSLGEFGLSFISVDYPLIRPMNSVAEKILSKRTVTGLYNDNPTWLQEAHRELDDLVLKAYGWNSSVSDEEIISGLRLLNTGKQDGSDLVFK
jgi:hypothetical protein